MSGPRVYRTCRKCGFVGGGGEFKILNFKRQHWAEKGVSLRRCPECGNTAQTRFFPVVSSFGLTDLIPPKGKA